MLGGQAYYQVMDGTGTSYLLKDCLYAPLCDDTMGQEGVEVPANSAMEASDPGVSSSVMAVGGIDPTTVATGLGATTTVATGLGAKSAVGMSTPEPTAGLARAITKKVRPELATLIGAVNAPPHLAALTEEQLKAMDRMTWLKEYATPKEFDAEKLEWTHTNGSKIRLSDKGVSVPVLRIYCTKKRNNIEMEEGINLSTVRLEDIRKAIVRDAHNTRRNADKQRERR
ncbi:MAG: hypothetical protein SGARI_007282 [Bacillariaceae sp.]